MNRVLRDYYEAISDTSRERAQKAVESGLQAGMTAEEIVFEVVVPAMIMLGDEVAEDIGTTLAQHYVASELAAEVTDRMLPLFEKAPEVAGRVLLGTAAGDFHGLGKRIVAGCLKAHLFEVIDLGLNVTAEQFVEKAIELDVQVIGVSSMMVHTARGAGGPIKVRQLLEQQGLEDRFRLAVGGAPYRFHPNLYREVGADAWAENGSKAATVIAELIRGLS